MKFLVTSVTLTILAGFLVGCSTVTIEGGGNEGAAFKNPITVHGSMYGFAWDNTKNVVLAQGKKHRLRPIYSVKVHNNYLDVLLGTLSLGLYYPQTFEYKLVVPDKFDDESEKPYNPLGKKIKPDTGQ